MKSSSTLHKILSLAVIITLLSLRMSTFTEEIFIVPVEDAIFDVAFIAEETSAEAKSFKVKVKKLLEFTLVPPTRGLAGIGLPQNSPTATIPVLVLMDLVADIFIPPESIS